jgi:Methylamine utilisation protein MauE
VSHVHSAQVCAGIVAFVFLVSAVAKLRGFSQFVAVIRGYRIITKKEWTGKAAALVVLAEAAAGLVLLEPRWQRWAASTAIVLLAGFTLAVVSVLLRRERPSSCGCMVFGRKEPIGWHICLRNLALGVY